MRPEFEPRTVFYRFPDGRTGPISITFTFDEDEIIDLGDEPMRWLKARAMITSDWYTSSVQAMGTDELQVICRLIHLTGIWITTTCRDAGATLFTVNPDDPIEQPYDVFYY